MIDIISMNSALKFITGMVYFEFERPESRIELTGRRQLLDDSHIIAFIRPIINRYGILHNPSPLIMK